MQTVKVNAGDLLRTVRMNREAHRSLFLKAQEGYRAAVIAELDKMLSEAREGKPIRRGITLPEPVDRTRDYDRVIRMLEMTVNIEVELQSHEFDQYVLDNWDWSHLVSMTNSSYLGV